jgi:hypothetical protein
VQSRDHVAIVEAVVAYNLELAERHKEALRTGSESNPEEVAVPIVVRTVAAEAARKEAVEAVRMVVAHTEMEVDHMEIVVREAVQAVRMEVEAVHTGVAVPNLVGLDHMTWIIPSCRVFIISHCIMRDNMYYHTTGVVANRQVIIIV